MTFTKAALSIPVKVNQQILYPDQHRRGNRKQQNQSPKGSCFGQEVPEEVPRSLHHVPQQLDQSHNQCQYNLSSLDLHQLRLHGLYLNQVPHSQDQCPNLWLLSMVSITSVTIPHLQSIEHRLHHHLPLPPLPRKILTRRYTTLLVKAKTNSICNNTRS